MDKSSISNPKLNNKGFSLVEMLVALAVSGIVLATIIAFVSSGSRFYRKQSNSIDLQNELSDVSNIVSDTLMEATALEIIQSDTSLIIQTGEYEFQSGKYVFTTGKGTARLIYWNGSSVYVIDSPSDLSLEDKELDEGYCYSKYVTNITAKLNEACKETSISNDIYKEPLIVDVTITVEANGESRSITKTTTLRNKINSLKIGSDIYTKNQNGLFYKE